MRATSGRAEVLITGSQDHSKITKPHIEIAESVSLEPYRERRQRLSFGWGFISAQRNPAY